MEIFSSCMIWNERWAGVAGGVGPEMTVITQKSSLQRYAMCPPQDGESNATVLLVFAPDTDCGESDFFTVYDTWWGGRREGAEQVEGS